MSWLATHLAIFGDLPWPEAIFLGLVAALTTALVTTAALALWRVFRPLPAGSTLPTRSSLDHAEGLLSLDDVNTAISHRLGKLQRDTVAETFHASDVRFGGVVESFGKRIDQLDAKLESMAKLTLRGNEQQSKWNDLVQKRIDLLTADVKDIASRSALLERAYENTWRNLERRCRFIDQGFKAIRDRERLLQLAALIETVGEELSAPTRREPLGDREVWSIKASDWQRNVKEWSAIASIYRMGVVQKVQAVNPHDYRGNWKASDDLFPDSVAIHDYKTFRIIFRNFQNERELVDRCIELAAFASPSTKGRGDDVEGE